MKKLLITLMVLSSVLLLTANQIRVNSDPEMLAPYTNLQLAIDEATSGDTIMVEGSSIHYDNVTTDKKLIIIGSGYLLAENSQTQFNTQPTSLANVTFIAGAEGSKLVGCKSYSSTLVHIYCSDITISKCYNINSYNGGIYVHSGANNTIVQKCFAVRVRTDTEDCSINILNNIHVQINTQNYNCPLIISNNEIIQGWGWGVNYSLLYNNIFLMSNSIDIGTGNSFQNNIFRSDQQGLDPEFNNLTNVDMSTGALFIGNYNSNIDNQYQLTANSIAIGAGLNGEDCGSFGGTNPYYLSGMPSEVPSIYDLSTTGAGVQGTQIQFNIKAKTHE